LAKEIVNCSLKVEYICSLGMLNINEETHPKTVKERVRVANYVFSSKNGTDKNIKSHKSIM
jgi:hypothetical protein